MKFRKISFIVSIIIMLSISLFANEKPYILVSNSTGTIEEKVSDIKSKLKDNGFQIVGEYSPFAKRKVLICTNDNLISDASKTKFGAYGSAIRVAFSKVNNKVQVAYTNPTYWCNVYRMNVDTKKLNNSLNKVFGDGKAFGSNDGISIKELKKYHYMFGMPYFDDPYKLAKFKNYKEAIQAVEAGLSAKKGGTTKVYRIDIPGKNETVFGVALTQETSSDKVIMDKIDNNNLKHTAYLCYEMVVSENTVYTLNGRFRIAISFPDLTMTEFTKIVNAPGDIKDALKEVCSK